MTLIKFEVLRDLSDSSQFRTVVAQLHYKNTITMVGSLAIWDKLQQKWLKTHSSIRSFLISLYYYYPRIPQFTIIHVQPWTTDQNIYSIPDIVGCQFVFFFVALFWHPDCGAVTLNSFLWPITTNWSHMWLIIHQQLI